MRELGRSLPPDLKLVGGIIIVVTRLLVNRNTLND